MPSHRRQPGLLRLLWRLTVASFATALGSLVLLLFVLPLSKLGPTTRTVRVHLASGEVNELGYWAIEILSHVFIGSLLLGVTILFMAYRITSRRR